MFFREANFTSSIVNKFTVFFLYPKKYRSRIFVVNRFISITVLMD